VSVVELRQYTLVPGRRDDLIDLFEAELIEPQEQCGMQILGTFRDLDDERRFVWVRAFADMDTRARSLQAFYGGPVWRRHRHAANATMIDSDDVLLLRPGWEEAALSFSAGHASTARPAGLVQAGIVPFAQVVDAVDLVYFCDEIVPLIEADGGSVLGCLVSEHAENTFPALPVREAENVLVWFAAFAGARRDAAPDLRHQVNRAALAWPGATALPWLLHLAPTARSRLTGASPSRFAPVHQLAPRRRSA
jgi:hypothetical protein